jgi:hypothetical protein
VAAARSVALTAMRHLAVILKKYFFLPPRNGRQFGPLPEEIIYNTPFLKSTRTFCNMFGSFELFG